MKEGRTWEEIEEKPVWGRERLVVRSVVRWFI